jgi:HAD superfamily hydrolase (TIGR01484 family)
VGATIVNGYTLEPIDPIQNPIEQIWPGELKILEHFKHVTNLQHPEVPQQRRCSFYLDDENLIAQLSTLDEQLGCDVLHSAGKYLDVLPKGINKGSTLTKLINYLNEDTEKVLVAGDTLNDLAMFECGFKGVVVGNAETALKK